MRIQDITPEMLNEAIEKTGFKPIKHEWAYFDNNNENYCGCALTLLICSNASSPIEKWYEISKVKTSPEVLNIILNEFNENTEDDVRSFTGGFDGALETNIYEFYNLGSKCSNALFNLKEELE